jgi:hypothetical protein
MNYWTMVNYVAWISCIILFLIFALDVIKTEYERYKILQKKNLGEGDSNAE